MGHQHLRVTPISDAAIPEDTTIGELNILAVILFGIVAELTVEARCR